MPLETKDLLQRLVNQQLAKLHQEHTEWCSLEDLRSTFACEDLADKAAKELYNHRRGGLQHISIESDPKNPNLFRFIGHYTDPN